MPSSLPKRKATPVVLKKPVVTKRLRQKTTVRKTVRRVESLIEAERATSKAAINLKEFTDVVVEAMAELGYQDFRVQKDALQVLWLAAED